MQFIISQTAKSHKCVFLYEQSYRSENYSNSHRQRSKILLHISVPTSIVNICMLGITLLLLQTSSVTATRIWYS